jgi:signal transduction histidine kinase
LRALEKMAAALVHDFNNCLSPIIGLSELILSRPKLIDDHDKVLKYVGTIHNAGLEAALVVSRLREYYPVAAGGEEIKVVDITVRSAIASATRSSLPIAGDVRPRPPARTTDELPTAS